jgi:diguanylate cyclase (GGDEF)-like protein
MGAETNAFRLKIDSVTLARFMPMHLLLDAEGHALSYGPTLAQVLQDGARLAARFEDLFEVRSPGGAVTVHEVLERAGNRFRLWPRNGVRTGLRGHGQRLPGDGRILLNLAFVDVSSAVRTYALSNADFAATDLALEVLFLSEANAAVTRELKGLSLRLEGARMAAEEEAMTDPLTSLRNRRAVDLVLDRLCSARAGFGLMHMDLDFFKAVNDTLGHAAGDHVLKEVAVRLQGAIRASDIAARIGGDEFFVVLTGMNRESAMETAERLVALLSQPYPDIDLPLSASVGVAMYPEHGDSVSMLAASADLALYAAKDSGKRRAVLAQSV